MACLRVVLAMVGALAVGAAPGGLRSPAANRSVSQPGNASVADLALLAQDPELQRGTGGHAPTGMPDESLPTPVPLPGDALPEAVAGPGNATGGENETVDAFGHWHRHHHHHHHHGHHHSCGHHGKVMTLYHQTSRSIGHKILREGFRPGHSGWCGGAIYFAVTPRATYHKAIGPDSHLGYIIEAKVDVGRVLHASHRCGYHSSSRLCSKGYDSITFNPGDGPEYVIYSASRVLSVKHYRG